MTTRAQSVTKSGDSHGKRDPDPVAILSSSMLSVTSPGTRPSISPRSRRLRRAAGDQAAQRAVVAPADLEPDVVALLDVEARAAPW